MYPALKSGAGGAAASGGSAAGATGSSGKGGSASGSAAGAAGSSSGKGGSAGGSAAGAAGGSSGKGGSAAGVTGSSGGGSTSKGGSSGSSDAGVPDAPGAQPDAPVGGSVGGTSTSGTSSTGGSGGTSSVALPSCPALTNPDNGAVSASTATSGSPAVYSCDPGYSLSGSKTLTCQSDGTWDGTPPSCTIVDCGGLTDPGNGSTSVSTTTYGSTADYTCNLGYGLSGTSPRTCQADGTWSGTAPTCSPADCPTVTSPSNGFVGTTGTTFGATANYSCQTGYVLSGAASRTCQADGTWSGTTPACTQIDCYQPAGILNGRVNATYTIWGSIASYTCDSGYSMTGSFTRTCQSDGTWSGTPPTCTLVDCGTAPSISNGTLLNAYATTYGSTASYTCTTGYFFSGSSTTRTCQADGTWSLPSPVCSIQMLKLTVSKVGHGTGTVTSSDGLVSCGSTCAGAVANYAYGTNIYLSAVADVSSNQSFMGWNGAGCTGLGGCQFTITVETTVTANFSPPPNVMFTTSKTYTPNLGGLSGADVSCNQLAAAAGLTGSYVAWLSTTNVSALSRLNGASGWVRRDGRPVLNSVDDLSKDKVFYPPRLDESGNDLGGNQWVMTNTRPDGMPLSFVGSSWSSCNDFTSETYDGTSLMGGLASGGSRNVTEAWGWGCSITGARLYCLGIDRQAQVAVIPAQGRHAFLTRAMWTPGGGVSSADALCQSEASAAKLSGTAYLALLPTTGSYAASRFNASGLPWVRSDGILIAPTASAFFSTVLFDVTPNISADGSFQMTQDSVWTGAATPMTNATDATSCSSWTSTSGTGGSGQVDDTATKNFFNGFPSGPYGASCGAGARLLCLQNY
jgi:hypothetical protein